VDYNVTKCNYMQLLLISDPIFFGYIDAALL